MKGFSTIEIVIATAIALIIMSGVAITLFGNQSGILNGEVNSEAVLLGQKAIEQEQALAREDFYLVNSTTSTETVGGLTYTKATTVTTQNDYVTKKIVTVISWPNERGQILSSTFTTTVTDLSNVQSPNTCNSSLYNPDGWKTPGHQVFDLGQLGVNNNDGNGFGVSDLAVFNGVLYATMYATPNTDKDTFFAFSIPNDPTTQPPVFLSSIDNNPAVDPGLAALTIASTTNKIYALVASQNPASWNTCVNTNGTNKSCAQLQIFDVTNASSLSAPIESFKLPTTSPALIKGTSGQAVGNSIFYKNGYVYLGLTKTASGPEFNIIDVGASTGSFTNPVWKGGYAVGNDVNSIYVRGNYAYIATPNNENMTILDISNPSNPTRVGGFTDTHAPDSQGVGSDHGETVTAIGNTVYLGRTYGTNELYLLDVTTPSSISKIGQDLGTSNTTSVYGLAVRDWLLFALTKGQFQVWNISNMSNITPWTTNSSITDFADANHSLGTFAGGSGTALDCEGNYVYTALASTQGNTKDLLAILFPGTPFYYSLANSGDVSVTQGSSVQDTITVTKTSGTAQSVALSVSVSPSAPGLSATLTPTSCTPNSTCTGNLQLSTTVATPAGVYAVTVTSGSISTTFNLTVGQAFDYSISASPSSKTLSQGSNYVETIGVTKVGGTAQAINVTLSGLQSGVSYTPATGTCMPNPTCSISFTISAASNAQKKSNTITVSGSSPTRSANFTLIVQ